MARIAGVNVPDNKHAEIALTAIFGIGKVTAQKICAAVGVSQSTKIKDLDESAVEKIRGEIEKGCPEDIAAPISFNQNKFSLVPNHPAIVAGNNITLEAKIAGITPA